MYPLAEKSRELIRVRKTKLIGDLLDRKIGGMQQGLRLRKDIVVDGLLGRQAGIFLYQGI